MGVTSPKTVLVTGAGRRIGRAIALDMARHGWAVAAHCNASGPDAEALAREIIAAGGAAAAVKADLAREDAAAGLVAKAADAVGPITCLINNASVFEEDSPETATRESWDRHMRVNLRAPFQLIQAFARQLPEGARGNVINVIDQRVLNVTPDFTSYTVSKVGLWGLTQTLALSLAPGIRVNAIGPGPTLPSRHQTEAEFERQWASMPLKRPVGLDEICLAVRFLLDAPSVTGQMIALDSGQHLGWATPPSGDAAPG